MTMRAGVMAVAVLFLSTAALAQTGTGPIIVVDTTKGTFEVETFQNDAPKTVAHVIALVKRGFYDGQRIHRALPGFLVQWGDPRSRDLAQESEWGRGPNAGSGTPVGVVEMNRKHPHVKGAVAMAHPGNPARADSQIFVTLANRPELNNRYAVFGHLVSGDDVPARLERGDVITRMYVKE
jgi:cyclophilin family peptidyl-prolyl cis-trans isomerase